MNIKQLSISLKIANPIINPSIIGVSTSMSIDYVGQQPISNCSIGFFVNFCEDIYLPTMTL